jgi:hypothetical protein
MPMISVCAESLKSRPPIKGCLIQTDPGTTATDIDKIGDMLLKKFPVS